MAWRKILGRDLSVREWLLDKIHALEAFWMLPDFDEELWIFSKGESFVLFRAPSSLRREFIAGEYHALNLEAIEGLKQLELDTSSFFCAQDLGSVPNGTVARRWATMLEPTPKERVLSKKDHELEALSVFKLLEEPASGDEVHKGYPEPLPVFYYELNL